MVGGAMAVEDPLAATAEECLFLRLSLICQTTGAREESAQRCDYQYHLSQIDSLYHIVALGRARTYMFSVVWRIHSSLTPTVGVHALLPYQ
jgi:hypothetical protein